MTLAQVYVLVGSLLALVTAGVVTLVRRRNRGARAAARAIAVIALLASAGYLVWRIGWTINPSVAYLGVPLLLAEVYWLLVAGLMAFTCWSEPRSDPAPPLPGRGVTILIATYNEDEDVLRPTVVGSLDVEYDGHVEVWVCDDGDRAWVREMCEELGARYVCRPAPRTHAKAGNLNHALGLVETEFVVTLDADHVPVPELLRATLGYFADPRMALVQAPQSFYNRGFGHPREDEDPLRNDQTLFFDRLMPGKDRHGAAFWCGCPSVLRTAALRDVGGVATVTVVEDTHTSLRMHARGWRSRYVNTPMAYGLAPEEITAFTVQRGRWALGNLQMLRRDLPLLTRGLSAAQRIEYTANAIHFLEVVPRIVGMVVPILVLTLGVYPIAASPATYWALFVPQVVLAPLASWALTDGRYRPVEAERFAVIRMETYLRALPGLWGRQAAFKVTPKGARHSSTTRDALHTLRLPLLLSVLGILALAYQAAAQWLPGVPGRLEPFAALVTATWVVLNAIFVLVAFRWARAIQHRRSAHRFPVHLQALLGPADDPEAAVSARIEDLSLRGARIVVDEAGAPAPGDRVTVTAFLDAPLDVPATVAAVRPGRDGEAVVGAAFGTLDHDVADAITRWCFRNPFGPRRDGERTTPETVPVPALQAIRVAHAQIAASDERARGPEPGVS